MQKFRGLKLPQAISTRKHHPRLWAGVGAEVLLAGLRAGSRVLALGSLARRGRDGRAATLRPKRNRCELGALRIKLKERGKCENQFPEAAAAQRQAPNRSGGISAASGGT